MMYLSNQGLSDPALPSVSKYDLFWLQSGTEKKKSSIPRVKVQCFKSLVLEKKYII